MNLPQEEQRVLTVLKEALGHPLRVVEISETLGIQHNHCSKLIKFLTDKGIPIQRDFVTIDGKVKSYKEYWITPEPFWPKEVQTKIDDYTEIRNTYPENSPHREKINIQIAKLKG